MAAPTAPAAFPRRPLAAWTYADAVAAVQWAAQQRLSAADYNANERYLAGDHWQDGEAWVGPRGTDETWPTVKAQVQRQFTPVGVIGEVLGRVANGLLKREADVTFAPVAATAATDDAELTAAQQAEADAMSAQVSAWWDRVTLWEHARTAVMRARALTRGVLRLAVAEGNLARTADGATALPTDLPLADAFRRVSLTVPDGATAAVIDDPATLRPVGVVLYAVQSEAGVVARWAELWSVGPIDAPALPADATVQVRRLPERGAPQDFALPFDRLPLAEVRGALLITEGVRRQQQSLDFGSSILNRTMETAGFAERYVINAEPQGWWSESDDGTALRVQTFDDGVTRYLHAEPRTLGASVTTELVGVATDEAGGRATPSVTIKEPTDPSFAITAVQARRADILHECKQAHVLGNSEAVISGYSRQQARADFENDLHGLRPALEGALRAVIEGAVATALAMTSDAELRAAGVGRDFLARFRVVVTCHVDAGPLAPDERAQTLAELAAGTLSKRRALLLLGTEDVDAELGAIAAEGGAVLTKYEQVARVLDALSKAASFDAAVRLLETANVLTKDEAAALLPRDTDGLPDGVGAAPSGPRLAEVA